MSPCTSALPPPPPHTHTHALSGQEPLQHAHTWPNAHVPVPSNHVKHCLSSTLLDVSGHMHKVAWQSLLIVGCSCLVKLHSPVNSPLRVSHPLFPRQARAALVSTASIYSNRGRANPPPPDHRNRNNPLVGGCTLHTPRIQTRSMQSLILNCHSFFLVQDFSFWPNADRS